MLKCKMDEDIDYFIMLGCFNRLNNLLLSSLLLNPSSIAICVSTNLSRNSAFVPSGLLEI